MSEQQSLVLEQFTQQAKRYAASPIEGNQEVLGAIMQMADPQPSEELLDLAYDLAPICVCDKIQSHPPITAFSRKVSPCPRMQL